MASGPQIIGMASGVTEISLTYSSTFSSAMRILPSLAFNISCPMKKKIMPPATFNESTEIPKNLNKNCPENANAIKLKNATIEAFRAVFARSLWV